MTRNFSRIFALKWKYSLKAKNLKHFVTFGTIYFTYFCLNILRFAYYYRLSVLFLKIFLFWFFGAKYCETPCRRSAYTWNWGRWTVLYSTCRGVCPIGTSMDSPNIDPNKKNPNHFKRTVSREFWDYNYTAHLATLIF